MRFDGRSFWSDGVMASPLVRGALEATLVPLAFVALGLVWAGGPSDPGERGVQASEPSYTAPMVETKPTSTSTSTSAGDTVEQWLVDGFNVVQVGLLRERDREGWWTRARREELMARVAGFVRPGATTWVVFDGPEEGVRSDGRLHEVYATSADDWLVRRVRAAEDPGQVVVVTADRRLANRVRHHGGRVVSPGDFLRECGPLEVRSV